MKDTKLTEDKSLISIAEELKKHKPQGEIHSVTFKYETNDSVNKKVGAEIYVIEIEEREEFIIYENNFNNNFAGIIDERDLFTVYRELIERAIPFRHLEDAENVEISKAKFSSEYLEW